MRVSGVLFGHYHLLLNEVGWSEGRMAVAEISGPKMVIRIPDVCQLSSEAITFMIERIRTHNQDGCIWIIPFFDHEQWKSDCEGLLRFGFDFFNACFLPYDERTWAKRVCVKYLSSDMPRAQILWINPNDSVRVFDGRPFELCTYEEFHEIVESKQSI